MTDILNKEKILEHAKQLTVEGRFDRAIAEYERLLQVDPDDLRVKIKIAELYVKRKQISEAIRIYTEVAKGYSDGGFYLKAATVFKNILRLNPSLIDVNIALSELYEKMGLVQDALYQYQIVISFLEQKGPAEQVLSVRTKMVDLDPANVTMRIRLAETYQLQGMTDKSIDMYEAIAGQLKESGNTEQLLELYSKILAHKPDRSDLLKEICNMYYKRGEWKEIIKRLETAKDFAEKDRELLAMQADVYARLNQIETAKHKYRDLAQLVIEEGDSDSAIKAFENVLYLSPEEESDVGNEVEKIREGAFPDVKKRVEERRKRTQEEAKRVEDLKQTEDSTTGETETAKGVGISQEEAAKLLKDADYSHNLGEMYKKTALNEEANTEFAKALQLYKRVITAGHGSRTIFDKIEALENMLGGNKGPEGKPEKNPGKKMAEPKKPKTELKLAPQQKKEKEITPTSKKKISFV